MGEVVLPPKEYPHTVAGFEQMAYDIISLGENTKVTMEATGRYHEPVAAALPETPSMTKLAYTAGVTFRPCKWMHVDLAYGYVNSADPERTGSYPYVNSVLALANEQIKNVAPEYPTTSAITDFSGNYTARAHTFSIGVGFSF